MTDVADFLEDRLAEAEKLAQDASRSGAEWFADHGCQHAGHDTWIVGTVGNGELWDSQGGHLTADMPVAFHIAAHDPALVLREVAAQRALIALYRDAEQMRRRAVKENVSGEVFGMAIDRVVLLERVLRWHATVHADHPAYEAAWEPPLPERRIAAGRNPIGPEMPGQGRQRDFPPLR